MKLINLHENETQYPDSGNEIAISFFPDFKLNHFQLERLGAFVKRMGYHGHASNGHENCCYLNIAIDRDLNYKELVREFMLKLKNSPKFGVDEKNDTFEFAYANLMIKLMFPIIIDKKAYLTPSPSENPVIVKSLAKNLKFENQGFLKVLSHGKFFGPALSFLNIKNLTHLECITINENLYPEWMKIINRHLKSDKDVLDCQEELIKAGLKDYAKL